MGSEEVPEIADSFRADPAWTIARLEGAGTGSGQYVSRTANAAAELRRFEEVRMARSVDDIVRLLQRIEARAAHA